MKKVVAAIYLIVAGLGFSACNIINPKEEIPTYVHIDSFKFSNPNPNLTGSANQAITSVWAYIDGNPIGVFDLPATIPVLANGTQELQLAPGVNNQGLKDYQLTYPFFAFHKESITATPGKVINITPETQYVPDLKYWIEDFETSNSFSKLSGDTSIRRVTGQDSVLEGGGSGCISLGPGMATAECLAGITVYPNTQGYLELNYKGNLTFQVGILVLPSNGTVQYAYLAGIKPKDSWGKFYVNVQRYTTQFANPLKFSVIIKTSLEEEQSEGYLLLDNIKVISY